MENVAIRKRILSAGLHHCDVAEHLKITPQTFSQWLRFPLPMKRKRMINQAIRELSEVRKNEKSI